ncbi:MAG: hypothetical protein ACI4SB_03790 [Acutalibacteraceae bacterium]
MEKDRNAVRNAARAVKILSTVIAVFAVLAALGGLGLYAIMSLIFDKTTIAVTDLPSAFAASVAEGTADIPVARVFASYIPTFAAVFISIFFFLQLRKTAKGIEDNSGRLFYKNSHKELIKLAIAGFVMDIIPHIIYFGLKASLSAGNLPNNLGNSYLIIPVTVLVIAFIFKYGERLEEKADAEFDRISAENISNCEI